MLKFGWVVLAMLGSTAHAQQLQVRDCNEQNIAFIADGAAKLPDGKQKTTATDELTAARDAMAKGDVETCKTHLQKATLQTK
jgi:hypothetical protein